MLSPTSLKRKHLSLDLLTEHKKGKEQQARKKNNILVKFIMATGRTYGRCGFKKKQIATIREHYVTLRIIRHSDQFTSSLSPLDIISWALLTASIKLSVKKRLWHPVY